MKKALNAWSVDPATGFEDLFRELKEVGFDGVELNVDEAGSSAHSLTLETTEQELAEIKELSERYGLPVVSISTSLYWRYSMGSAEEEIRDMAKAVLRKQLSCAKSLGADGILVVPGGVPDRSYEEAYATAHDTIFSLLPEIEESKVHVGVENVWNGFFLSPFDIARFVDGFSSPYICSYYDAGNMIAFSWSERWIEVLGNRINKVHIKDYKRNGGINSGGDFVDLLEGDVNWPAVIPALRKAGFDSYLTAEVDKGGSVDPSQSYQSFYRSVAEAIGKIIEL